jgi:phosphonopyruvate decarboxylase
MITRAQAINAMLGALTPEDLVVTTTGLIARQLFAAHARPANFYMLGSMGLSSALGLGLALLAPERRVMVLEGDGSALMSLGNLPLIANEAPPGMLHVVLDNQAYESTGSQPTITDRLDLASVAKAAGYRTAVRADEVRAVESAVAEALLTPGPHFLLVKVALAPGEEPPRVSLTPQQIRDRFSRALAAGG